MVFVKQNRTNERHPDGADCLIPLSMTEAVVEIKKNGGKVVFSSENGVYSHSLDDYRAQAKKSGCVCMAGTCN